MKRNLHLLPILLLSFILQSVILNAQDGENITAPEIVIFNNDTTTIVAYESSKIPDAFLASNDLLVEAGNVHFKDEDVELFNESMDTLFVKIGNFLKDSLVVSLEEMNVREITQIGQRARLYITDLKQSQKRISDKSLVLEAMLNRLSIDQKRWLLTLSSIPDEEQYESRIEQIGRALTKTDSMMTILHGDLALVQVEQDRFSEKQNNLKTVEERVAKRNTELSVTLLTRGEQSFFKALKNLGDTALIPNHLDHMHRALKNDTEILKAEYGATLILLGILFFVVLGFAYWYRRHFASLVSVDQFEIAEIHLALVYSPLLTISFILGLTIRFALSGLPQTYMDINLMIFMIPLTIIVIRQFGQSVKLWFIFLMILYVFTFVYELIYFPDILQRVALLGFSMAGLALVTHFLVRQPRAENLRVAYASLVFNVLMGFFALLLLIAIVANLVGAFRLAEFLTLLPIQIIVLAVAVLVTIKVFDAIIFLFLSSKFAQQSHYIAEGFADIYKKVARVIEVLMWFFFLSASLNIFRVKDVVFKWFRELFTDEIKIGETNVTLEKVFIFILVIWLSVFISRIMSRVLEKDVFTRVKTAKGMPSTIVMMLRIILISAGLFLGAKASGMQMTNISIVLGAFSVGIGFGLQNIFNNMVSGFILAFERPIKVGDVVQVGELVGEVKSIGLRASTIKAYDGAEVVVPNGNLVSNEMINWTLSDSNRRMDIRVGVAYGTDPDLVLGVLEEAATSHTGIRKKPPARAYFIGFGDSSLDFRLLAWAHIDVRLSVESEIRLAINQKLKEAKIEIPFPQTDLHIKSDSTRAVPKTKTATHTATKTPRKAPKK